MSDRSKLKLRPEDFIRSAVFDREKMNDEERTIEMAISSEEPYERWYGIEILDHGPGSVDMSRMLDGAPLLFNHREHIGTVVDAKVENRKLRCRVKFSKSAIAQEKWQDVKDGILTKCSVGYRINEMIMESEKEGVCTYRAQKWQPYEATLCPVPADNTVGIGRNADGDNSRTVEILNFEKKNLANESEGKDKGGKMNLKPTQRFQEKPDEGNGSTATVDVVAEQKKGATAFRERSKKMREYANEVKKRRGLDCSEILDAYMFGDKTDGSFEDFRSEVLISMEGLKPVETSPELGLSKKEKKSFSLLAAMRNISAERFKGTFEKEVSDAAAKLYRRTNISETTLVLPEDITSFDMGQGERDFAEQVRSFAMQVALWGGRANRAQNVTTATAGGFTVPTVLGSMIELLRNKTVLGQVGVTELSGLQGDMALPVQTGGATAYWVSENGALTDSEATFGQKTLTPHRLGGTIPFTTQFIAQSSLSAEQFVRSELMTVIAIALDLAGLLGTGVAGEPLGIANTTGINATVTYGGSATWADVVEHETGIAVDNADIGSMAFILDAATVGKWKTILRDSVAGADYLLDKNMTANGYPVFRTNQISSAHQSFFGVFAQLIRATWAGIEVIVDPYTLKKSGQVEVTMNSLHDYLCRQPLAFNVSTDSAAA